ncbi:dihydroorotase [Candidatus Woesearchaeota archaeon]|nr:dihydroorotase [Candidatus Woesearchaeota archaeon]
MILKNVRMLLNGRLEPVNLSFSDKIDIISKHPLEGDEVVDGNNNILLPGMIDPHVHFREPGLTNKEDFYTGSCAAAAGGVTTVCDMPNTVPPTITKGKLMQKLRMAKKSIVNFGLHFGAALNNLEEIRLANDVSFSPALKVFMGSTTGELFIDDALILKQVFSASRKIIAVHAEDERLIEKNMAHFRGEHDPSIHSKIRSHQVAVQAVMRAIETARATRSELHICHLSTSDELQVIRDKRFPLSWEATPHHLFMTIKDYKRLGNCAKMNPPLRYDADRQALWDALKTGNNCFVASDHAPHSLKEKHEDYWKAPGGVPGVETSLPLLLNEVNKTALSLSRLINITSLNAALRYRMIGKARIKEGYDADLVLVDMKMKKRIKNDDLFTKCGWSPFEGRELQGWPVKTFVNGNLVFEDGSIYDEKKGRPIHCKLD